ncbi:748_t:CDS:1, partial [Cetraspora pellucida]
LKRQVQHYQKLYEDRVAKDLGLEKKDGGTQTDLSDRQVNNLITQWNEVVQWATEEGIDVNQRWNLGMLRNAMDRRIRILTEGAQRFEKGEQKWQEEKDNLIKSKREELTAKMAELRENREKMEQLYKEQLAAKDKEIEELSRKKDAELAKAKEWMEKDKKTFNEEMRKAAYKDVREQFQIKEQRLLEQLRQENEKFTKQEAL